MAVTAHQVRVLVERLEQRSSDRGRPAKKLVEVGGFEIQPIPAIVIDESSGGLALAIPDKSDRLFIGDELSIDLGDVSRIAVVRHQKMLPWGTQLGLEWKAHALARHVRDVMTLTFDKHQGLIEVFSTEVASMWQSLETHQWGKLVACASRLRNHEAISEMPSLLKPIDNFQNQVRANVARGKQSIQTAAAIEMALHDLIKDCACTVRCTMHAALVI